MARVVKTASVKIEHASNGQVFYSVTISKAGIPMVYPAFDQDSALELLARGMGRATGPSRRRTVASCPATRPAARSAKPNGHLRLVWSR